MAAPPLSRTAGCGNRSRIAQQTALCCLLALLALFALQTLWLDPPTALPPAVALAIQALPLLAFLPSAIKGSPRSMVWLCLVLLLYFIVAVPHLFLPAMLLFGILEVTLITLLFVAAMLFVRWHRHERTAADQEDD